MQIEALAHLPIERDLIVSAGEFVRKLEGVKPYLIPREPRASPRGIPADARGARTYEQFSACINCMLCYAACPEYGLNPDFLGPGVLALLHRYNADSRDGGQAERMPSLNAEEGVWTCMAVGYCSEVCPKRVDPAHAVNQNKAVSAGDYFGRFLKPKRGPS